MEASRARTITTIIGGALEELRERRARIQPFVDELKSIERAIAQLEKAAGGGLSVAAIFRRVQGCP